MKERAPQYFKSVAHLSEIDIYRISEMWELHPCAQHALKKIICAGQRGYKDVDTDIDDVISTLQRWKRMREEDRAAACRDEVEAVRDAKTPGYVKACFDDACHPDGFPGSDYPDNL